MWKFNDASQLGASGMDIRPCPNYENGFDVCDPLGTVLENLKWSGRSPARVLRRRCRSEGVDRSPYEHVSAHRSIDPPFRQNRTLSNKSHFTLNATESELHRNFFFVSTAENGDYIMAQDHKMHQSYHPGRSKLNKVPSSLHHHQPLYKTSLLPNTKMEEQHLPKVEELLDKDYEMMEVPIAKQPLKSILNNPLPKTQPTSILKKPKSRIYQDSKEPYHNSEGRRRQRASSESDNLYYSFNYGSASGCDGRISSIKRPKDMMNVGYSYGSAIANINPAPIINYPKKLNQVREHHPICPTLCKEEHNPNLHVLRTTAINNNTTEEEPVIAMLHPEAARPPESLQPHVNAAPQVKVPVPVPKKVKTIKKKTDKAHKMKSDLELHQIGKSGDEDHNKTLVDSGFDHINTMETEALIAEIEKLERARTPSPSPPPSSIQNAKTVPLSAPLPSSQLASQLASQPASQLASQPATQLAPQPVPMSLPAAPFARKVVPVLLEKKERSNITKLPQTIPPLPPASPALKQPMDVPFELPRNVQTCLRPSLFPRVPPYLRFVNHDEVPSLKVPMAIQRHLKWKLTSITPIVVKKTLTNSGFRLVRSDCDTAECPQEETLDWVGIWGKHMKSIMFRAIKDGQKMNHFPGTFQIGRKDRLWRNLQKLVSKHGVQEFGIMPKTYVLPYDLKLLKYNWEKHQEDKDRWIIKPPASARGTGIKVVSRWTQIPKKRAVVVQRYVSKPYLINGSKFDMRLYVLVTSVHPLRIYLYKDGLARFASVKYNDEVASLNDRYMHLTNYSINKLSKNYTPNEDFSACEGHKWTLQTLFQYLKTERNVDTESLWESMKDLVIKTIISGEASISSLTKANVTSRYNCYELFGVDVLLDEDLKPWLLEVNISPSLHSASPLDIHVKGPLVTTVLNIAQYQVPHKTNLEALSKEKPHKLGGLPYDSRLYTVYLSKEERDKHIIYTNIEERDMYLHDILSTLTSDDVRHLIQAEDELTQAGDMERVFPTKGTFKYLEFLSGPRYYNRLFDAWESRYTDNRETGIQLLRNLCDIGYHLEVPPVPLKNDVDAPSPAPSERPSVHSIPSAEFTSSQTTLPAAPRTCGDAIAQPAVPPPLEPRA